jgi:hypothetical protein
VQAAGRQRLPDVGKEVKQTPNDLKLLQVIVYEVVPHTRSPLPAVRIPVIFAPLPQILRLSSITVTPAILIAIFVSS